MKLRDLKYIIKEQIKSLQQEQGPRPSGPPTEEEFKKLLQRELRDAGYSDEEIAKLHPLIWIVIGATFVKWLDNQIEDD